MDLVCAAGAGVGETSLGELAEACGRRAVARLTEEWATFFTDIVERMGRASASAVGGLQDHWQEEYVRWEGAFAPRDATEFLALVVLSVAPARMAAS